MSYVQFGLRPAPVSLPPADEWITIARIPIVANQPILLADDEPMSPRLASTGVRVDLTAAAIEEATAQRLTTEAERWAAWFAQLLVEALAGRRRLDALDHWLADWVLAEISRRVRSRFRDQNGRPNRSGRSNPTRGDAPKVNSIRAQFTSPTLLEVSTVVVLGGKVEACAFQLGKTGNRWRCASLQLAGPEMRSVDTRCRVAESA